VSLETSSEHCRSMVDCDNVLPVLYNLSIHFTHGIATLLY